MITIQRSTETEHIADPIAYLNVFFFCSVKEVMGISAAFALLRSALCCTATHCVPLRSSLVSVALFGFDGTALLDVACCCVDCCCNVYLLFFVLLCLFCICVASFCYALL